MRTQISQMSYLPYPLSHRPQTNCIGKPIQFSIESNLRTSKAPLRTKLKIQARDKTFFLNSDYHHSPCLLPTSINTLCIPAVMSANLKVPCTLPLHQSHILKLSSVTLCYSGSDRYVPFKFLQFPFTQPTLLCT